MSRFPQDFIGNREMVERLCGAVLSRVATARAYLLYGPDAVGKHTAAVALARQLLGLEIEDSFHPDLLDVEPTEDASGRRVITISQARAIRHFLSTTPAVADRKIVIIDGVEHLTTEAANTLLKTLEEPPEHTILFLIAHEIGRILPTIRSRALPVRFALVPDKMLTDALIARGIANALAHELVECADGRPGRAMHFASDASARAEFTKQRTAIALLLDALPLERLRYVAATAAEDQNALRALPRIWLGAMRSILLANPSLRTSRVIRNLFTADDALQTTNANAALILERALLVV